MEVIKLHDDEVDIDAALVARLPAGQFPEWAGLPVRVVAASGTDNVTFRVGDTPDRKARSQRSGGPIA
ncbi:hypothetical protein ACIBSW_16220 [Actinoplanes sp. NPDC049668]|uniref:hypothetical protein n=1 Tax=unclassified Actinoplanes TaxID=2626549 RepID=UPI0033B1ADA5